MKTTQLYEIIKSINPDAVPMEFIFDINDVIKNISAFCECFYAETEVITPDGNTVEFDLNALGIDENQFIKFKELVGISASVRNIMNATYNDLCWKDGAMHMEFGLLTTEKVIQPVKEEFKVYYYASPKVEEDDIIPPKIADLVKLKMKADHYAIVRQWDRAGYFNRQFEKNLVIFRKAVWSSSAQRVIFTQTSI